MRHQLGGWAAQVATIERGDLQLSFRKSFKPPGGVSQKLSPDATQAAAQTEGCKVALFSTACREDVPGRGAAAPPGAGPAQPSQWHGS